MGRRRSLRSLTLFLALSAALGLCIPLEPADADGLRPADLGVIFRSDDPQGARIAAYYAKRRHVPPANVVGLGIPGRPVIDRDDVLGLRTALQDRLPSNIQSLLLVWSRPYAAGCMSITTALAAGYRPDFCEPGCGDTHRSPLFDSSGWLPADTAGWTPAMLLPTDDEAFAHTLIDRGIRADGTHPPGTVYLVSTQDSARNVRAAAYPADQALISNRIATRELTAPVAEPPADAIGYFTGTARVAELAKLGFRPGAIADHLTSVGGVLDSSTQMPALAWLEQGATASYGTVSEPCNKLGKFPNPAVLFNHYLRGESLLEAYWKSVAMPGQGLFIGEPLARPFGPLP